MDAPATKVDVKNINGKLDKVSKTLVDNSSTLVQLIEEMREIRKSQQFLSDQYEEVKKHLHSTYEEVKTLRIENQDLKDHVRKLEAESGQMQEDINNLEQYGRRECLEFLNFFNSIMSNRKPVYICIFHINIRSLRKNIGKLSNMLSTMQKPPHIVAVSETKINKNDGLSFPTTITGYNFLHSDSEKK